MLELEGEAIVHNNRHRDEDETVVPVNIWGGSIVGLLLKKTEPDLYPISCIRNAWGRLVVLLVRLANAAPSVDDAVRGETSPFFMQCQVS